MSRRRPGPDTDHDDGLIVVRIVCTGRRTHREVRFGHAVVSMAPGLALREAVVVELPDDEGYYLHTPEVDTDGTVGSAGVTRTFTCRRCDPAGRRRVPLREENLLGAVWELARHGESRFDVSAVNTVRITKQ